MTTTLFKKTIVATTLLLGALTATTQATNEAFIKPIDINELQVTAQKAQIASESMRIISTINREQIANIPAASINELLKQLPGIDIRQRGGNGVQADVSMRGGTFDQVLILLNGVNISDTQTGHHNLDLPIDLSMVERIEVLQGTNVQLFGLSAFSGAINIITEKKINSKDSELVAKLTAGDHGMLNPVLGGRIGCEKWNILATASHSSSEGYMDNTDYMYTNAYLQAVVNDSISGKWNVQLGGQVKDFGANGFYSLKYPNQFEATKTLLASAQWQKQVERFNISAGTFYRTHYDRFELIRAMENAPDWYKGHNYHLTHTTAGNIKTSYASSIGRTSVGMELRNERIYSNVLGDKLEDNSATNIPFTQDTLQFSHGKNRLNVNYFAEQTFCVENWAAGIGISSNWNNLFGHNYSLGANVGYQFAPQSRVYANVSRSLRLPTFTDLYYQSATQIANPALKPEQAWQAELGAQWQSNFGLKAQASAFYRIGQDIIDWVKTPEEEKWRSTNHTQVNATGAEVSLSYHHGYWLKHVGASYSFVHIDKETSGNLLSKYALDYLRNKFTLQLEHGIYKGLGASWTLNFQQREGTYQDLNDQTCTYTPVWLLDGRLYWKNETITLFAEASNITNRSYFDYGGIMQPGLWLKGGIIVRIND